MSSEALPNNPDHDYGIPKPDKVIARHPPNDGQQWENQCARCGSSMDFEECWNCEDGYSGHDCGEDCCCCADPEPNVVCDVCHGDSGWWRCLSGPEWCEAHPRPGRENVDRGEIEWYVDDDDARPRRTRAGKAKR